MKSFYLNNIAELLWYGKILFFLHLNLIWGIVQCVIWNFFLPGMVVSGFCERTLSSHLAQLEKETSLVTSYTTITTDGWSHCKQIMHYGLFSLINKRKMVMRKSCEAKKKVYFNPYTHAARWNYTSEASSLLWLIRYSTIIVPFEKGLHFGKMCWEQMLQCSSPSFALLNLLVHGDF